MVDTLILKKKPTFLQKSTKSLQRSVIILFSINRTFCLQRQDSLLSAKERITFSWSNLSVEVPGSDNKRCCGILSSKGEPRPQKQILKNGREYAIFTKRPNLFVQLVGLYIQGSFLPSWEQAVLESQLFSTLFYSAIYQASR